MTEDHQQVVERTNTAPTKKTKPKKTELSNTLAMLATLARDPTVSIDKLKELVVMQERVLDRAAEAHWNEQMQSAQGAMTQIAADSYNSQTKSKYASYAALDAAVRPIYIAHGFSLSFNTGKTTEPNMVLVQCLVSCGGHTRLYEAPMPADGKGPAGGAAMSRTHAVGAAFSYGQRYLLGMIFNIAVTGKREDDGNGAAGGFLDEEQVEELKGIVDAILKKHPRTTYEEWVTPFLKWMGVDALNHIPKKQFAKAKAGLNGHLKDKS